MILFSVSANIVAGFNFKSCGFENGLSNEGDYINSKKMKEF